MLAEKIVALRIATRKACMCENAGGVKKNTLSLKTKLLFLIKDKPLPPADLMGALCILKTNLALLTKQMIVEGLIEKEHHSHDKREITYHITDWGKEYLKVRLSSIQANFKDFITTEEEEQSAEDAVSEVLSLLSFIG